MSLWSQFFGRPAAESSSEQSDPAPAATPTVGPPSAARNATIAGRFLTLRSPGFFGVAYVSRDGRWVVGCFDGDEASSRGGCRDSGNGRVVLVDLPADQVIVEVNSLARPMDAAVADNGSFAVLDRGFGMSLESTLLVFDEAGGQRFTRHFHANTDSIGLSRCGKFAVAQTANNPDSTDGDALWLFDVSGGKELFSRPPATEWAREYDFDVDVEAGELRAVRAKVGELGWFRYSASGDFMDEAAYFAARLERGDYADTLLAARELLDREAGPSAPARCVAAADRALEAGATDDRGWCTEAHRIRGEAYERMDRPAEAIAAYELAIASNPKVGLKKRVAALIKKQQTKPP